MKQKPNIGTITAGLLLALGGGTVGFNLGSMLPSNIQPSELPKMPEIHQHIDRSTNIYEFRQTIPLPHYRKKKNVYRQNTPIEI